MHCGRWGWQVAPELPEATEGAGVHESSSREIWELAGIGVLGGRDLRGPRTQS